MAKSAIEKTIREMGAAMGFSSLRLEGKEVIISAAEFISFALKSENDEEEEEEEEEDEIAIDLVRKAIASLGGKGTSSEIRSKLKEDHGVRASAADLRPALATLMEAGELSKSGEARAKVYSLKKRK